MTATKIERLRLADDAPEVWWEPVAYWACWSLLAILAIGLAAWTNVI